MVKVSGWMSRTCPVNAAFGPQAKMLLTIALPFTKIYVMKSNKIALEAFIRLYDFHTKLFHNVLVDISEEDAINRLGTKANHIAWLAGSLVYERYAIVNAVGGQIDYTPNELFVNHKGIQEGATYPSLQQYKNEWELLSPVLKHVLENLTESQLNGPDPFEMPGKDLMLFDTLTFCVDRESYCIGQIGLYRRLLGYEAMKYD